MKKTLLTLALVGLSAVATYAQGSIQFLNSGLSPVKYIDAPGATAVNAPLGCVIGVYWGTTRENVQLQMSRGDSDTAVINTTAGVFSGGSAYTLPGTMPGETVFLKIGGWLNKGGTTPRFAPDGKDTAGITHYGESAVVQTTGLGATAGPGTVVWQSATGVNVNRAKPFNIELIPEPSVVALGALGLGALLLRRRKA